MSEPFLAEIRMFAGNFAPQGWAFCNGQIMSIAQNTALFSLVGTTYGGDGQTTFALPNLQSRVPIHWGQGPGLSNYVWGEQIGTETVTLLSTQMPSHNHSLAATTVAGGTATPSTGTVLANSHTTNIYGANPNTTLSPQAISQAGGNQPHNNIQPVLAVSFIIALEGIYPSRG